MKETNNELPVLPPAWCGSICRNSMSEICVEHCSIVRDCSGFELKKGIDIIDLPRFPIDEISEMTKEEKYVSVAVYVAKITDHLKGEKDEPESGPVCRPNPYRVRSIPILKDVQVKNLLSDQPETDPSHQNSEERKDPGVGPSEVAGASSGES